MTRDEVKNTVTNALGKGMKMDALTDLIVSLADAAGLIDRGDKLDEPAPEPTRAKGKK